MRTLRDRLHRALDSRWGSLLFDIAVGVFWALVLAAVIAFENGVSQFIYIDF